MSRKKKDDVEVVREFNVDELEKDEDGKVILPDDITYAEFLHFTHPELSPDELRKKIAQEKAQTWFLRFMLAGILVIVVIIIVFIVTS